MDIFSWLKSDASRALEIFFVVRDKERIRRETVPLYSPQLNGCAEESRIAMHEAATFAARFQAKNLLWRALEKVPKETDGLWVELITGCGRH